MRSSHKHSSRAWPLALIGLAAFVGLVAAAAPAAAAGRVELVLVTEGSFPATETQRWLRLFTDLKVGGLRIRARTADDEVAVVTEGTADSPVYRVTGVLTERNELLLPGAKFSPRDGARISAWLEKLKEEGPGGEKQADTPFGLSGEELKRANADLSRPLGVSTKGVARPEALIAFLERRTLQLTAARNDLRALDPDDKIEEELKDVSAGTALACLLRPAGLGLVPQRGKSGSLEYVVAKPAAGEPVWPVGFPAEDQRKEKLPKLFEFFNVEIDEAALSDVLPALEKRLEVPFLVDHNGLALEDIDPAQVNVSLPSKRTTFGIALKKVVQQAKLKSELRLDEAGNPFIWITPYRSP